ncbi:hypothetical protein RE428_14760 [Marinobacter nanhaiticus D15-8W]|uniref:Uncharacterized protein n=1 Tax=Marinobacter nanhaiticus D15-8W TaxID=626887 RepID=N6WPW7_9GAMM|nr:hypothetical protein [Marinobacter nanhaiticus]ENO13102.1 hypothetical protein J057_16930 [Marinobacter nanhaiticus D15-8W]BES70458.1 hypothetical protein RE428_14760 [Marinobacter nanhaiticus D15-8W]
MNSFETNRAVEDIVPNQLAKYLIATGWIDDGAISNKAKIWHRPEEAYFDLEVIQPLNSELRDYYLRVSEAIQVISEFEERTFGRITEEIINYDSDIIKVRVVSPDVEGGAIPIDDGVLLFERAKDLLVSSTLSAFKKKKFFSGSWPAAARDFLDTLRFGQTERGSYVVNVIAPLIKFSHESFLEADRSITRSVSNNLSTSLQATISAINKYEKTKDLMAFEEVVSSGVSANLCDALIGISGSRKNRDVEISIELAPSEKDSHEIITLHRFSTVHIPVLETASEYYKGNYVIRNYEVYGLVVRMDHEPSEDYGTVRVSSMVNGSEKNISMELGLDDYWEAVRAHKPNIPVTCQGDLHVTPRSAYLVNPRGFKVLDKPDLFDDEY